MPLLIVKVPFIVGVVETVRLPFIVRLLNVACELPFIVPAPENIIVLLAALNVPLFVKVPPVSILRLKLPDIESVASELIVTDATLASAVEIEGLYVVPDGIVTAVDESGTVPTSQLLLVFQSEFVTPIHVAEANGVDGVTSDARFVF